MNEDTNPAMISESDSSTAYTAKSAPESEVSDLADLDDNKSKSDTIISFSIPWPGSTYIIRSVSSGQDITLIGSTIVLSKIGGRGSHWACVDTQGWLGFRNAVSGKFLGRNMPLQLSCFADQHRSWEHFCVRMTPEGGYVLLMRHWDTLWQVGSREEQRIGVERLERIGDGGNDGMVWEFIKV